MRDRSNNFRMRLSDTRGDLVTAGNPMPTTDLLLEIARGNVPNTNIVHKFGSRYDIDATYAPVTTNGVYQTPQVAAAVALRVKAGNANDTAAGDGAREVTLQGLDETGAFTEESIATAGEAASAVTTTTWIRLFRLWVSASGTYASPSAASHAAAIVIETAGDVEWASIDATGIPKGQSQIAIYTVPLGRTAYLASYNVTVQTGKEVDFILFKREGILDAAAPYQARRTVTELFGLEAPMNERPITPYGPFNELTDIGWMAQGASTPDVTVDFELIEFFN